MRKCQTNSPFCVVHCWIVCGMERECMNWNQLLASRIGNATVHSTNPVRWKRSAYEFLIHSSLHYGCKLALVQSPCFRTLSFLPKRRKSLVTDKTSYTDGALPAVLLHDHLLSLHYKKDGIQQKLDSETSPPSTELLLALTAMQPSLKQNVYFYLYLYISWT